MTSEKDIDFEIKRAILAERKAKLAKKWAKHIQSGNTKAASKIEAEILKLKKEEFNL